MKQKAPLLFNAILSLVLLLLFTSSIHSQVVIFQQGFDSTSGSQPNGTWTNVDQIQNGGNDWTNSGTGNDVIEGNYSCSGWSTCNDKTGHTYGITGGAPVFKGTGTNVGYGSTNSSYFAIFDDYDASSGTYGEIYSTDFSLSGYTSCNLTFYWNNANSTSSYIQVQYYNGSSWTGATNFGEGTGSLGWHEATMSLPSTATEVVFFIVSDYAYYAIGLDQIEIYGTPTCTLTASISSHTNVSPCSYSTNGAATVSASGGTTPYTYSWTPSSGLTGATTTSASGMSEATYTCTVTDHAGCTATPTVTIGGPAAIRDSMSSTTNVSCYSGNNGSATVGVKGGTSPYTYSWSSSHGTNATASSMTAGSYTCTITDAHSCTATATVTITQPNQLRDSISSSTNVLCNGSLTGSATVGVKGGTTPYTYSWSPSGGTSATASNLAAGTFTITVTDHNSCTNTASVTITQPGSAVSATITSNNPAPCNGENGSAGVTAGGGTPPYTYSWTSGGGTNSTASLPAGTYTVTVKDHNNCTASATVTISQPAVFSGTITTYNICGSGSTGAISVQLTGGTPPYTYSWTPNVSTTDSAGGLSAGNYTVTINDAHGCGPLEGTTTITTITAETVTVTSSNVSCYGGSNGSATASASPTHDYVWSPGGSTSATISSLSAGSYTVVSTETDGCTATATVNISQPSLLSVSTTTTNITCNGAHNGSVQATVTGGTTPYAYSWNTSPVQTGSTATGLGPGTYTLTVTDTHSCTTTATVTVTQPAVLTASASGSNTCSGSSSGSVSVSVTGGTTPYSYSWSPGGATTSAVTGLGSGTYSVTVTDHNACTASSSVSISSNPTPTVTLSGTITSLCTSNSQTLTASGATNYTWSPSSGLSATTGTSVTASPSSTTTFTVTGSYTTGCSSTANILVKGTSGYTYTSVSGGGNWSNPSTWTGGPSGTVPTRYDAAIIAGPVTEDIAYCITNLTVNSSQTLTISSGASTLGVYGTATNNGTISGGTYLYFYGSNITVLAGAGAYTNASWFFEGTGQTIASSTSTTLNSNIVLGTNESGSLVSVVNNGTVNLPSNKVYNDGSHPSSWTNVGTLLIGMPSFTNSYDTLHASATGNIINYQVTSSFTIKQPVSNTYYSIYFSGGGSNTFSFPSNLIVLDNFVIFTGTVDVTASNYSLTLGGDFASNGIFNAESGTVIFNGNYSQSITGANYPVFYGMTISGGSSQSVTLGHNQTVTNLLTITSGTLDATTSNYNLIIDDNFQFTGGTFNARGDSLKMYGGGAQALGGSATLSINKLVVGGSSTTTLSGNLTAASIITINSGGVLDVSTSNYVINVAGNWTDNGSFTHRNGTVNFVANGNQCISDGSGQETFENMTVSAITVLGTTCTVNMDGKITIFPGGQMSCTCY